jgi:hypothetical protein
MNEHPWMEHDKTHHRAQLPDDPYWRANGWFPVDGPHPEPDYLHDLVPEAVEAKQEPEKPAAKSAPTKEK